MLGCGCSGDTRQRVVAVGCVLVGSGVVGVVEKKRVSSENNGALAFKGENRLGLSGECRERVDVANVKADVKVAEGKRIVRRNPLGSPNIKEEESGLSRKR
ncbi:uncharacterized protein A4U43_C04F30870 [Asparagus officinalis]|uniref:Uncharacterized protein n=1 Tax=Asparagus officinalis TaxID=4686 RepID=A0A5P1F9R2_ASPOF|nr:uncharacterized protein A4U43_C04F30870 [Asparagus officinalis]